LAGSSLELPKMAPGNAAFIAVFCLHTACEATRNPILSAPQGLPNLGKEPQHHLRHLRHGTHGPTETAAAAPRHAASSHRASHKAHAFHAEKDATGSQQTPSLNPYYTGMPSDAKEQIGFADGRGASDEHEKKEDEKKEDEKTEENAKPEDSDEVQEPEHLDKEGENEHGGKPGGGGKPTVPREHEHGDTDEEHEWSYEDPKAWKAGYAKCGGKAQSPVNISGNISKGEEMEKLQVNYVPLEGLHLDNNGHNLQVNGKFGNLTLKGGTYQARQLHFHFPSEHAVGGKLASGEMQIVHQKIGSNGTNDLAVISVLLNTEYDNTEIYPPEIEFMMQLGFDVPVAPVVEEPAPVAAAPGAAPAPSAPAASPPAAPAAPKPMSDLPKEGTSRPIEAAMDIGKVFEKELSAGYYHYEGSLTTPPCSETVQWFVLDQRAPITQHMVNNFKELFPNPSNNRPVQPLNGREVEWSNDEVSTTTTPVPMAKDGARGGQAYLWLLGLVLAVSLNA